MSLPVRILLSLLGLSMVAACGGAPVQEPPPRVAQTVKVERSTLSSSNRFPAVLRSDDRGRLGFELGGLVARVNVDVGDRFRRGALLATLQANQQQLGVRGASASLAQAQASAREAELDFGRKSALEGTGAVSQSEVDSARRVRDEAVARVNALKAQREQAADTLRDTRLYAPYAGVVTNRLVEPAEVVGVGQPVLEVTGLSAGLEAIITVPSRQRSEFSVGRRLSFVPESGPRLQAVVQQINAAAGSNGLFEIILSVPNAARSGLAQGSRGEVILSSESALSVRLPLAAVRMGEQGRGSVLVVDPKTKKVAERRVVLGQVSDGGVAVMAGLKPRETVVVKGARLLRPGEIVRPTSDGPRQFNQ
ncbi:MAG: efflux RND transporter periplasmic adaptor subunit [Parasphingorhabdus sp.]|uniref:efflux RND transporter periplasmic adaptor subunit n=1 Tax=Parasphingorhabdus sp. TaxID=2709688 RepID=UPI0030019A13